MIVSWLRDVLKSSLNNWKHVCGRVKVCLNLVESSNRVDWWSRLVEPTNFVGWFSLVGSVGF